LNITNPTLQKHVFVFRGPGLKHNQYHDIHEGQTVTVYVGTENECHAILKQHQAYGLRKRADALSVRGNRVGGLLYSIDSQEARPIDVEDLAQIKQQDGELLDDLAAKERELYAIGAAAANTTERREERSLEVSVRKEGKGPNGRSEDIQTVQVSRKNERSRK
jgi:hypothetical protein